MFRDLFSGQAGRYDRRPMIHSAETFAAREPRLDLRLSESLVRLAATARAHDLGDDWIVFGGAAMVVSGLTDWDVPDIDVLASPAAARTLIEALGGEVIEPKTAERFRSRTLARIDGTPVAVEIMVGLEVHAGEAWEPVIFHTRDLVAVAGERIPVPHIAEQAAMARRFGRAKDLVRAEALEQLIAGPVG